MASLKKMHVPKQIVGGIVFNLSRVYLNDCMCQVIDQLVIEDLIFVLKKSDLID